MRLFVDTANIDDIRRVAAMGVVDGVTTNPTLVAKEGVEYRDRVVEICEVIEGPISAEGASTTAHELVEEGKRIASWHPNVVVKVPLTEDGLQATSILSSAGIQVNCTLVFSANQALLAARAGAAYISPFVGRLDDAGQDGMEVVHQTVQVFETYHLPTQVLAASLRHPQHVTQAALAGAHVATVPPAVILQMVGHPLTDAGLERFLADAAAYTAV